ncbi:amino acid adenylation domain-containing protein [Spirillospora sp. CA-255316]
MAATFRAQAARTPQATALETDGAEYTYAELDAWVEATSLRLRHAGAGPERVVAVALPRSPALTMCLLAVNRAGAAFLPIDPDLPRDRVGYMLENADPTLILYGDATRWIADLAGEEAALHVPDRPDGRRPCASGGEPAVHAHTPAYLIYTSGSTGRPKGVVMGRGALDNLLAWHLDELGTGPGRRVAQFTAIGFDIAVQEIFSTLVSGATLVIPGEETRRDPWRLVRWLGHRRVTDLFCPNLVMEAVCETALAHGFTLPDLEHIAQAGEQLTLSEAVRTFYRLRPGRRLYNHYGPTETHAATSYVLPVSPDDWPGRAPVGQPIWNTGIRLLDGDLNEVPDGADGEVFATGTALARGYHGRTDLTADRFVPDPHGPPGSRMYRTGDIARRRPDGMLEYLGRADQQVKIRGVRVEPGEVDAAIRALPGVRDVTVLVRGDGSAKRLDAYLVPAAGAVDVAERTRERLLETLPEVMVPSTFTLLSELPKNSNGKVDRNALPVPAAHAAAGARDERTGPGIGPGTGTAPGDEAAAMARLFGECLEIDQVSPDDDLIQLGLNSLSAAKAATRIRSVMGLQVTIADVFRNTTVRRLCAALRTSGTAVPPVTPVPRGGRLPASFAQERLWVVEGLGGPGVRYHVPMAIRMRGPLDEGALRAAVGDLVGRHEALRTKVVADSGGLRQEISPGGAAVEFEVTRVVDASWLDQAILKAAGRPFDLGKEIPVRAHLFSHGNDRHVLLLLIHHIAVDGWSIKPLAKDLGFAYSARLAGMAPPWQPLPVQYADHASRQRDLFDEARPSEPAARQIEYWRDALRGVPELLSLETDLPRPDVLSASGERVPVRIGPELHRAVHDVARGAGCTVFMVVHAALAVVLNRRGAGTDVVVGATVAGRSDGALDDMVGFFVNTLALRADLTGDPTLAEVLQRVRETDLRAMEHQELPFDWAVELVGPERSMAYNPVVQVMLAFQVGRPEAPQMPGLETEVELLDLKVAKFDLTFELTECFDHSAAHDGIRGHLEFSTDLFTPATAREIVNEVTEILEALTEDTSQRMIRTAERVLTS